jgi:hypothetical protein
MLIPRSQIVEKIVKSPQGVDFKLVFFVYEEAGKVQARLISATPLETASEPVLALSGAVKRELVAIVVKEFERKELIPSPFESLLYRNRNIARGPNL